MADLSVSGLTALRSRLDSLPGKLVKNALKAGLRQAANLVKDEAKGRVPADTGALKASLRVVSLKGSPSRIAFGVVAGALSSAAQKKFGQKSAFYAVFVEKGTVAMKARPFMLPALESKAQAAIDKVAEVVADKLQESLK